ncbi:MAG: KpsF/GutQ family sugar-phosphate isomerase [Beijerinckiaceae bacterium]
MTPNKTLSAHASAARTIGTELAGIKALHQAFSGAEAESELALQFAKAVAVIAATKGRVIVSGMGKSGHVGRKIAATFASTGTPAYFVHPAEASHGDLGMVTQDDVILALSWSGEAKELADIIAYSRRFKVCLIAITANAGSALGRQADIPLVMPKAEEACPNGQAPTTSTTMQMVMGDALAVALLEAHGFSADDFRTYHPGGKLGAQLMFVGSVMHSGDALPVVTSGMALAACIPTMSSKGFGTLIVTNPDGTLAGIVTDGDLRRHMGPDLAAQSVDAIMTRNPRTIGETALAAEALEVINSRKITSLVVLDEAKKPTGLVHIQDLLRLGIM